jgi:hypothetical protein
MKNDATNIDQAEALLPHFVYLLFDPKETTPFYVGKGMGKRDLAHKEGEKDKKEMKIKEIKERGEEVSSVIVGRYETEAEAFSVEATFIKWVYGFNNLTNQVRGRRHIYVRPYSEEKLKNKEFEHLNRIDREKSYQVAPGEYTKNLLEKIKRNEILQKLAYAKEALRERFPYLQVGEEHILSAQDPCILISGFSEFVQIQVRMPPGTGRNFTINYLPINSKSKNDFEETIIKLFPGERVRKGGFYGRYYPYMEENEKFSLDCEETEKIVDILEGILNKFKQLENNI